MMPENDGECMMKEIKSKQGLENVTRNASKLTEGSLEATHVGLAAGLFASIIKDGADVVVAAGRAPAAARAVKVGIRLELGPTPFPTYLWFTFLDRQLGRGFNNLTIRNMVEWNWKCAQHEWKIFDNLSKALMHSSCPWQLHHVGSLEVLAATNLYLAKQGLLSDKIFAIAIRWDRAPRGYVNRAAWKQNWFQKQPLMASYSNSFRNW